jgi:AraC family transcriptional activator of tynA and feaB
MSVRSAEAMVESLQRLVGLATKEAMQARDAGGKRSAITEYIEAHLCDPELNVRTVAQALDYSVRHIHRLFGQECDVSISDYIWGARLERGARSLGMPDSAHLTVTDIAHTSGFTSSAHFSLAFRAMFGVLPSEYRRARLPHV